jgi:Protein of unknown function (DUF1640)
MFDSIQLEMDDHRNEARAELNKAEVHLEDIGHRATLSMGDLRTEMEQAKWDNTRRGIGVYWHTRACQRLTFLPQLWSVGLSCSL